MAETKKFTKIKKPKFRKNLANSVILKKRKKNKILKKK